MAGQNNPEQQRKDEQPGKGPQPDAGLANPGANVGMDDQCIVPDHPESARQDTGLPCDDGRGAGQTRV